MPRDEATNSDENVTHKFEFTARALSKLPVPFGTTSSGKPKDRECYYDTKSPGLQVVRTSDSTTFWTRYWSPTESRPVAVRIGRFPGVTLEVARKLNSDNVNEIAQGRSPDRKRKESRNKLTVGIALCDYINWLRLNRRKSSSIILFEYLADLICVDFENRAVDDLTPEMVVVFRSRLMEGKIQEERKQAKAGKEPILIHEAKKKKRPNKTLNKGGAKPGRKVIANRAVRFLSQTYNHLIKMNVWDGKNPCVPIKPFPEQARTRRLEDDELIQFIATCGKLRAAGDLTIPDFLLVCLFTGIRRRNVSSAQWGHFDLDAGCWNVPETKNGLPVKVYLSPYILKIIKERRMNIESEWVFPAVSSTGHLEQPLRGLYRVLDKAKINKEGCSIHMLKHTFISYAFEAGINPIVISRMGGHKMREITARYGHASDKALKEGYNQVAEHMLEIAGLIKKLVTLEVAPREAAA